MCLRSCYLFWWLSISVSGCGLALLCLIPLIFVWYFYCLFRGFCSFNSNAYRLALRVGSPVLGLACDVAICCGFRTWFVCWYTSCTPSVPVIGLVGSVCSFIRSLCVRLRSRSFNRYALLCFVVLVMVVVGSAVV